MDRTKFAFILVIVLLLGTCVRKDNEVILIGSLIPLTGENAFWGQNIKNGVDLATEEVNQAGGILGKRVKIVYEDSQGKPTVGTQAVNKLISVDSVQAIIGDTISSVMLAVAPIANKDKIVLLGFGESAEITNAGDYIFRNWNSAASDAEITAEYAARHSKAIAVLSQNDAFGRSARELFSGKLKQLGVPVVCQEEFPKGQTDFRTIIGKLANCKYDGIYIASFHPEALAFLRQFKELGGKQVNFYGVSSWEENSLIGFVQENFPGRVFYGYPLPPNSKSPLVKKFTSMYTNRYGKKPEILADNGYDALYMLKYGIEKAGTYEGEKIKDALYTLKDFEGASGKMSFDKNGDVHKPFGLKSITASGAGWIEKLGE